MKLGDFVILKLFYSSWSFFSKKEWLAATLRLLLSCICDCGARFYYEASLTFKYIFWVATFWRLLCYLFQWGSFNSSSIVGDCWCVTRPCFFFFDLILNWMFYSFIRSTFFMFSKSWYEFIITWFCCSWCMKLIFYIWSNLVQRSCSIMPLAW